MQPSELVDVVPQRSRVGAPADVDKLVLTKPGTMTKIVDGKADTADYDRRAADLVNYMVYMAEPVQTKRHQIGAMVILFLSLVLLPLAYFLKKEYWKDVH